MSKQCYLSTEEDGEFESVSLNVSYEAQRSKERKKARRWRCILFTARSVSE